MQLIDNPNGNYQFLTGISPYSSGVVAMSGFEVVHAILKTPLPYEAGFDHIAHVLSQHERPKAALCAVELRLPEPVSFEGFSEFNKGYVDLLKSWDVLQDPYNPIARTNIAPSVPGITEPSLYGFAFTVPSDLDWQTFVVAGAGDLVGQDLSADSIVRKGETHAGAMRDKAEVVMGFMLERLNGLDVPTDNITATNIYSESVLQPYLKYTILEKLGAGALHGVRWHYSRPPIAGLAFEMDMRGVRQEIII